MTQHDGLVDLGLAEPGALLSGGEYLDGHVLAAPAPPPDLAEATLAYDVGQLDLASDRPLHQQGQPYKSINVLSIRYS